MIVLIHAMSAFWTVVFGVGLTDLVVLAITVAPGLFTSLIGAVFGAGLSSVLCFWAASALRAPLRLTSGIVIGASVGLAVFASGAIWLYLGGAEASSIVYISSYATASAAMIIGYLLGPPTTAPASSEGFSE
jgi:hypothetical protein